MSKKAFRSISDLQDYNDDERDFPSSLADDSQYEPIETLVGRMIRGEFIAPVADMEYEYPSHDSNGAANDLSEAFANQSILDRDGADKSDMATIRANAEAALQTLRSKDDKPSEPDTTPAPAVEVPTDKK